MGTAKGQPSVVASVLPPALCLTPRAPFTRAAPCRGPALAPVSPPTGVPAGRPGRRLAVVRPPGACSVLSCHRSCGPGRSPVLRMRGVAPAPARPRTASPGHRPAPSPRGLLVPLPAAGAEHFFQAPGACWGGRPRGEDSLPSPWARSRGCPCGLPDACVPLWHTLWSRLTREAVPAHGTWHREESGAPRDMPLCGTEPGAVATAWGPSGPLCHRDSLLPHPDDGAGPHGVALARSKRGAGDLGRGSRWGPCPQPLGPLPGKTTLAPPQQSPAPPRAGVGSATRGGGLG